MNYTNPHAPGCYWHSYAQTYGAPNIKWCEETLCQFISEPANTWSNLGFLIVGIIITILSFKKKDSFEIKQFGPLVFFMGASSLIYHFSNYYTSQILDFIGMFLFLGWTMGMNFIRLGWLKKNGLILFNIMITIAFTVLMHMMYKMGVKFQGIVLISGFVIIASEIRAKKLLKIHYKYFIAAVLTLVCAFGFSIADGQRLWCEPTNHGWFEQGHAIWHWCCSLAMYFIYLHYSQKELQIKAS